MRPSRCFERGSTTARIGSGTSAATFSAAVSLSTTEIGAGPLLCAHSVAPSCSFTDSTVNGYCSCAEAAAAHSQSDRTRSETRTLPIMGSDPCSAGFLLEAFDAISRERAA